MNPAETRLGWEIAGTRIAVVPAESTLPEEWSLLFPSYRFDPSRGGPVEANLEVAARAGWCNPVKPTDGLSAWRSRETEKGIRLDGPDLTGTLKRVDAGCYEGSFTVEGGGSWGVASLLRLVLSQLLAERGMLFLHASGVVRDGRLWLFSGSADSGKTTIATELCGGGEPFCVDRAVLSVEGKEILAHPTPFSDPDGLVPRRPPFPLGALVFIEQAAEPWLETLTPARAAALLLRRTMVLAGHEHAIPVLMDRAAAIAERTGSHLLRFARDERFWRLLDRRVGAIEETKGGSPR
jgi:hypothetical protein